jgi:hypothetical protein
MKGNKGGKPPFAPDLCVSLSDCSRQLRHRGVKFDFHKLTNPTRALFPHD